MNRCSRTMLRAKIHRVTVTQRDVQYEGSLTLDPVLLEQGDMVPFERIEVYDVDNGNRFATYLIAGRRGSGECCVNGAAARLVDLGDRLILASYTTVAEQDVPGHRPRIVLVGTDNRMREIKEREQAGVEVSD